MKKINILSLFDGYSGAQLALKKIKSPIGKYFASEICKWAIKVTQANNPGTLQIGNVTELTGSQFTNIDLLIGGSPCQDFSFDGKQRGMITTTKVKIISLEQYIQLKGQGFEFEGQSFLFWEFVRLLHEVKPKYFLLENVAMSNENKAIISKALGVHPLEINSALLTAQNRDRLYWTNIGQQPAGLFGFPQSIIQQPKDKGLKIIDILETEVADKYYLSDKMLAYLTTRKANYNGGKVNYKTATDQASCITSNCHKLDISDNIFVDVNRKARTLLAAGKSGGLHSGMDVIQINPSTESNGTQPYQQNRIYDSIGKSPALLSQMSSLTHAIQTHSNIRRFTPTECERLQSVPDNYTAMVSDTQRYRLLGLGFTVDVIAYIISFAKW